MFIAEINLDNGSFGQSEKLNLLGIKSSQNRNVANWIEPLNLNTMVSYKSAGIVCLMSGNKLPFLQGSSSVHSHTHVLKMNNKSH